MSLSITTYNTYKNIEYSIEKYSECCFIGYVNNKRIVKSDGGSYSSFEYCARMCREYINSNILER